MATTDGRLSEWWLRLQELALNLRWTWDRETRALFHNLRQLARQHVLFGHQDALAYGYDWVAEPGRSDVRDVSGSYPAVYGWEVGGLETGAAKNLDGVDFNLTCVPTGGLETVYRIH